MRGGKSHVEAGRGGSDARQAHAGGSAPNKRLTPTRRRATAWLQATFAVNCRRACRLARCSRAAWYRQSKAKDQRPLPLRIRVIAEVRPRFGYNRVCVLLRCEGWRVNLRRVQRLYRLEGMEVRLRVRKRRHRSLHRGPVPSATGLWQRWSMDCVHDQLANGRAFRVPTVVDQWSRESPLLEVVQRITGADVAAALDRHSAVDDLPQSINVDQGTEITSQALDAWACARVITLAFTRPGNPRTTGTSSPIAPGYATNA